MKVQFLIPIVFTVLISGCAHTRHVSTTEFDAVNKAIKGKQARIKLTNGNIIVGRKIQLAQDSTLWTDSETCRKRSIPTSEINYIFFQKRWRGALQGFGIGLLIGGFIGADDCDGGCGFAGPDGSTESILMYGGTVAVVWGLPIGAMTGSKEKFVLKQTPRQAELVKPPSLAKASFPLIIRSETLMISSEDDIRAILESHGFYDAKFNKNGKGITHQYEAKTVQDAPVILDHFTGLMWMQGGSTKALNTKSAGKYICKLNEEAVGGFTDWRFPTLEEAMSLMEPPILNGDLYINSLFDQKQQEIWTADRYDYDHRLSVNFKEGGCFTSRGANAYVRAVRSQ